MGGLHSRDSAVALQNDAVSEMARSVLPPVLGSILLAAITAAIELNGIAVEANKRAFTWGRRAAEDLDAVAKAAAPKARAGKKRRRMTAAEKKAVSLRMKASWAKRKKAAKQSGK